MNVDSIKNGIVIDHIKAGNSMELYHFLNLENQDCSVAIIKNVVSKKMGKKDIIKIDADIDIDLNVLGYIDPDSTVNIIKDGKLVKKCNLTLPDRIENVITCKNPRCITTVEQDIKHVFKLTDRENRVYRCIYCDSRAREDN